MLEEYCVICKIANMCISIPAHIIVDSSIILPSLVWYAGLVVGQKRRKDRWQYFIEARWMSMMISQLIRYMIYTFPISVCSMLISLTKQSQARALLQLAASPLQFPHEDSFDGNRLQPPRVNMGTEFPAMPSPNMQTG